MRVFSFSNRSCPLQKAGGPGGVNYRLFLANVKYKLFSELYHVFSDIIIEPQTERVNPSFYCLNEGNNLIERLRANYRKLGEEYFFTNEDVFLFHEVESALAFTLEFSFVKTVLIYHQQGSLYYEYLAFGKPENAGVKAYFDLIFREALKRISVLAFPSMGAKDALIQTEPSWGEAVEQKPFAYLYNGCDCEGGACELSEKMENTLEQLKVFKGYKFATVSTLNHAKGVEQIPEYLANMKSMLGEIKWVIVGDGPMKVQLECNITQYGLEENVIWIQKKVKNDEIMELYSHTDYYIMAHRFSIFDFATIEAMALGNVPVLTKVGGNIEIIQDNGFFIEEIDSMKQVLAEKSLEDLKQQNIQIARSLYSEYEFLNRYKELCNELENL